jgi:hypothetical protein
MITGVKLVRRSFEDKIHKITRFNIEIRYFTNKYFGPVGGSELFEYLYSFLDGGMCRK